jgi:cytochrome c5
MSFTLGACGKSQNSTATSENSSAAQSNGETADAGMMSSHPGMTSGAMPMHKMMQNGGGMSSNTTAANGATSSDAAASPSTSSSSAASTSDASTSDASSAKSAPKLSGEQVYQYVCAFCHRSGLNGAPKYGDEMAWAKRVSQGKKTVYDRALHGYRGMPPKGGHPELSDAEVDAAVDYMVNGSGGWSQ